MKQTNTPPIVVGIYGGLIALACGFGMRFLIIPDPDPTSRAIIVLAAIAFVISFGVAMYRAKRREEKTVRDFLNNNRE